VSNEKLLDALELSTLAWQADANCLGADADLFFPERGASTRRAKAICGECAAQAQCLEYAIVNGERFGIWGGLSERERRRLRKERALRQRKVS
jgi:WhiB family redox-sensing transcriptional regulator